MVMRRLQKGDIARLPAENIRNDSFLQRLLLTWVYAIVHAGRRGQLRQEQARRRAAARPRALCMPGDQAAEAASERFQEAWRRELSAARGGAAAGARRPSMLRALVSTFGAPFALAGVYKLMWSTFVLLGASYFVNALIEFVQKKQGWDALPHKGVGWALAGGFFLDSVFAGLALQRMGDVSMRVGIKVRAALITALYRKSFVLQRAHNADAGNVVSLVSTDCIKMYEGVHHFHNVWTAPLEAAAIIALLLWRTGGVYGLPALGVVLVVLPLQYYFGYAIARHKMANVEVSDARVLRMHEVLLAIKLVKFYVWEKSFARQVKEVRDRELQLISKTAVVKTLNLCLVFAVPPVIALVIFATYAYSVGPLQSSMAFVVLSLFNTLRFPLVVLPKALRGASEAVAAMKRIQAYLELPETEEQAPAAEPQAVMHGAKLHYDRPDEFTLSVPEFEVKPGEVVAVVGRVGSGKSSVLQAILNKMTVAEGSVAVGGRIAYVPQTAWVQNLSLRDNILFGMPHDVAKYAAVIHACALELDLQILPHGDASMAGERGINLSGGQRQRVCLARAAYHDADLLLLDNPLSAVDQHTSKHIFDKCIRGLLADKACDKVAIVKDGAVVYFGPHDAAALQALMPVDHMMGATVEGKESAAGPPAGDKAACAAGGALIKARRDDAPLDECLESAEDAAAKFSGTCARLSACDASLVYWRAGGVALSAACLFVFALTQTTRIMGDWWIRRARARAGFPPGPLPARWAALTGRAAPPRARRSWAADEPAAFNARFGASRASQLYLLVYMALVLLFVCLLLTRDTVFSVWSDTLDESLPDTLHMTGIYLMILLTSLAIVTVSIPYYAIMTGALFGAFFMMQARAAGGARPARCARCALHYVYLPAATVLKRWAGETASALFVHVDESLQGMDVIRAFNAENVNLLNVHHLALFNTEQTHLWLAFWCDFFGAVLVVATCLFSVAFSETLGAPNVLVFFTWVVRGVADAVSMWDAVERVTSFATTVPTEVGEEEADVTATSSDDGAPPALGPPAARHRGVGSLLSLTGHGPARRPGRTAAARRQASLRLASSLEVQLPAKGAAAAAHGESAAPPHRLAGVTAVVTPRGSGPGGAADAGGVSPRAARSSSPFASATAGPGGAGQELKVVVAGAADASWPATGDLRFEGVCLRYFPGAPLALRHVSFHVADCEKVGIVGRTGSGKTTLLMALFRMMDLAGGRILVDGLDIAALPLREVRKRISIIPQEPVMFKGSVRSNLDPFGEASDNELWHALALVHLKQAVADLPGGLDGPVLEGGSNFSLGQKQLICMARCVLKQTHILVLDEATAAMDLQTDLLIQRTIRRVFRGRTTLTIAHRLDTIIFSDKILAMAQGQVKEFDRPAALLGDAGSMFNSLVEDTGPVASAMLRQMAAAGPGDDAERLPPRHVGHVRALSMAASARRVLAAAEEQARALYTEPAALARELAALRGHGAEALAARLAGAVDESDVGDHCEHRLGVVPPAAGDADDAALQAAQAGAAALRALVVGAGKEAGFAQLPLHGTETLKEAPPLGLVGADAPLVQLLRRVAHWWLHRVAYEPPGALLRATERCELLFRLLPPHDQLAAMADIVATLASPALLGETRGGQEGALVGRLDTPVHTATLLSMLKLAQQLAVAEAAAEQQQQRQQGLQPGAQALLQQVAALQLLQPPALAQLRLARAALHVATGEAAAPGAQQQEVGRTRLFDEELAPEAGNVETRTWPHVTSNLDSAVAAFARAERQLMSGSLLAQLAQMTPTQLELWGGLCRGGPMREAAEHVWQQLSESVLHHGQDGAAARRRREQRRADDDLGGRRLVGQLVESDGSGQAVQLLDALLLAQMHEHALLGRQDQWEGDVCTVRQHLLASIRSRVMLQLAPPDGAAPDGGAAAPAGPAALARAAQQVVMFVQLQRGLVLDGWQRSFFQYAAKAATELSRGRCHAAMSGGELPPPLPPRRSSLQRELQEELALDLLMDLAQLARQQWDRAHPDPAAAAGGLLGYGLLLALVEAAERSGTAHALGTELVLRLLDDRVNPPHALHSTTAGAFLFLAAARFGRSTAREAEMASSVQRDIASLLACFVPSSAVVELQELLEATGCKGDSTRQLARGVRESLNAEPHSALAPPVVADNVALLWELHQLDSLLSTPGDVAHPAAAMVRMLLRHHQAAALPALVARAEAALRRARAREPGGLDAALATSALRLLRWYQQRWQPPPAAPGGGAGGGAGGAGEPGGSMEPMRIRGGWGGDGSSACSSDGEGSAQASPQPSRGASVGANLADAPATGGPAAAALAFSTGSAPPSGARRRRHAKPGRWGGASLSGALPDTAVPDQPARAALPQLLPADWPSQPQGEAAACSSSGGGATASISSSDSLVSGSEGEHEEEEGVEGEAQCEEWEAEECEQEEEQEGSAGLPGGAASDAGSDSSSSSGGGGGSWADEPLDRRLEELRTFRMTPEAFVALDEPARLAWARYLALALNYDRCGNTPHAAWPVWRGRRAAAGRAARSPARLAGRRRISHEAQLWVQDLVASRLGGAPQRLGALKDVTATMTGCVRQALTVCSDAAKFVADALVTPLRRDVLAPLGKLGTLPWLAEPPPEVRSGPGDPRRAAPHARLSPPPKAGPDVTLRPPRPLPPRQSVSVLLGIATGAWLTHLFRLVSAMRGQLPVEGQGRARWAASCWVVMAVARQVVRMHTWLGAVSKRLKGMDRELRYEEAMLSAAAQAGWAGGIALDWHERLPDARLRALARALQEQRRSVGSCLESTANARGRLGAALAGRLHAELWRLIQTATDSAYAAPNVRRQGGGALAAGQRAGGPPWWSERPPPPPCPWPQEPRQSQGELKLVDVAFALTHLMAQHAVDASPSALRLPERVRLGRLEELVRGDAAWAQKVRRPAGPGGAARAVATVQARPLTSASPRRAADGDCRAPAAALLAAPPQLIDLHRGARGAASLWWLLPDIPGTPRLREAARRAREMWGPSPSDALGPCWGDEPGDSWLGPLWGHEAVAQPRSAAAADALAGLREAWQALVERTGVGGAPAAEVQAYSDAREACWHALLRAPGPSDAASDSGSDDDDGGGGGDERQVAALARRLDSELESVRLAREPASEADIGTLLGAVAGAAPFQAPRDALRWAALARQRRVAVSVQHLHTLAVESQGFESESAASASASAAGGGTRGAARVVELTVGSWWTPEYVEKGGPTGSVPKLEHDPAPGSPAESLPAAQARLAALRCKQALCEAAHAAAAAVAAAPPERRAEALAAALAGFEAAGLGRVGDRELAPAAAACVVEATARLRGPASFRSLLWDVLCAVKPSAQRRYEAWAAASAAQEAGAAGGSDDAAPPVPHAALPELWHALGASVAHDLLLVPPAMRDLLSSGWAAGAGRLREGAPGGAGGDAGSDAAGARMLVVQLARAVRRRSAEAFQPSVLVGHALLLQLLAPHDDRLTELRLDDGAELEQSVSLHDAMVVADGALAYGCEPLFAAAAGSCGPVCGGGAPTQLAGAGAAGAGGSCACTCARRGMPSPLHLAAQRGALRAAPPRLLLPWLQLLVTYRALRYKLTGPEAARLWGRCRAHAGDGDDAAPQRTSAACASTLDEPDASLAAAAAALRALGWPALPRWAQELAALASDFCAGRAPQLSMGLLLQHAPPPPLAARGRAKGQRQQRPQQEQQQQQAQQQQQQQPAGEDVAALAFWLHADRLLAVPPGAWPQHALDSLRSGGGGGGGGAAALAALAADQHCDWCDTPLAAAGGGDGSGGGGSSGGGSSAPRAAGHGCPSCSVAQFCSARCAAAGGRVHAPNCWRIQALAQDGTAWARMRQPSKDSRSVFSFPERSRR
ncbi:abcC3 [Scenedesmus sp. PABB004]|nr:abcC3 [Scenedesmus sp. PABB004]